MFRSLARIASSSRRILVMATRSSSEMADLQNGRGGSIKVQFDSDVAVITMERGENRMNDEFIDQMNAALDQALSKPTLKAIITTGQSGTKFYCNGLDLAYLGQVNNFKPNHLETFVNRWNQLNLRFLTLPVLTVAAIDGHAFAGGAIMTTCHDLRVMQTDRGWWCLNEADMGLFFPPWFIKLVRVKYGGRGARGLVEATVFGKRFTASEAKDRGIVNEISTNAELLSTARSCINAVVREDAVRREFVQRTKEQIYEDVIPSIYEGYSLDQFYRQSKL